MKAIIALVVYHLLAFVYTGCIIICISNKKKDIRTTAHGVGYHPWCKEETPPLSWLMTIIRWGSLFSSQPLRIQLQTGPARVECHGPINSEEPRYLQKAETQTQSHQIGPPQQLAVLQLVVAWKSWLWFIFWIDRVLYWWYWCTFMTMQRNSIHTPLSCAVALVLFWLVLLFTHLALLLLQKRWFYIKLV